MPTITIDLEEEPNRLIEIYRAAEGLENKQEAINKIVLLAKGLILSKVK